MYPNTTLVSLTENTNTWGAVFKMILFAASLGEKGTKKSWSKCDQMLTIIEPTRKV